jgi:hypothetical protein
MDFATERPLESRHGAGPEATRRFDGHTTTAMAMKYVHLQQAEYLEAILSAMELR